ncbi:MAG: hypothetical protein QW548_00065 [Candidatus Aenigmatarchaeota archaeon]
MAVVRKPCQLERGLADATPTPLPFANCASRIRAESETIFAGADTPAKTRVVVA